MISNSEFSFDSVEYARVDRIGEKINCMVDFVAKVEHVQLG